MRRDTQNITKLRKIYPKYYLLAQKSSIEMLGIVKVNENKYLRNYRYQPFISNPELSKLSPYNFGSPLALKNLFRNLCVPPKASASLNKNDLDHTHSTHWSFDFQILCSDLTE